MLTIEIKGLRVDRPDFKATEWKPVVVCGKTVEICTCHELIDGKWEGFVSYRMGRQVSDVGRKFAPSP